MNSREVHKIWIVRPFKEIIDGDISEFESYMLSHAVGSPAAKM